MRDELYNRILMILVNQGIDAELVKSNLIVTLNDYEITSRTTEIAVVNEDDISKYLKLFLISKKDFLQHKYVEKSSFNFFPYAISVNTNSRNDL